MNNEILIVESPGASGTFQFPMSYPLRPVIKSVELLSATIPYVSAMAGLHYLVLDIGPSVVRTAGNFRGTIFIPINQGTSAANGFIVYNREESPQKCGPLPYINNLYVNLEDTANNTVNPGAVWKFILRIIY